MTIKTNQINGIYENQYKKKFQKNLDDYKDYDHNKKSRQRYQDNENTEESRQYYEDDENTEESRQFDQDNENTDGSMQSDQDDENTEELRKSQDTKELIQDNIQGNDNLNLHATLDTPIKVKSSINLYYMGIIILIIIIIILGVNYREYLLNLFKSNFLVSNQNSNLIQNEPIKQIVNPLDNNSQFNENINQQDSSYKPVDPRVLNSNNNLLENNSQLYGPNDYQPFNYQGFDDQSFNNHQKNLIVLNSNNNNHSLVNNSQVDENINQQYSKNQQDSKAVDPIVLNDNLNKFHNNSQLYGPMDYKSFNNHSQDSENHILSKQNPQGFSSNQPTTLCSEETVLINFIEGNIINALFDWNKYLNSPTYKKEILPLLENIANKTRKMLDDFKYIFQQESITKLIESLKQHEESKANNIADIENIKNIEIIINNTKKIIKDSFEAKKDNQKNLIQNLINEIEEGLSQNADNDSASKTIKKINYENAYTIFKQLIPYNQDENNPIYFPNIFSVSAIYTEEYVKFRDSLNKFYEDIKKFYESL